MGTLVIHKKKNGRWLLAEVIYKDGGERRSTVPIEAYVSLGFSKAMTVDEAKARAKQLNKQKRVQDKAARQAAQRVADEKLAESAYLPSHLVEQFEQLLEDEHFGAEGYLEKARYHWSAVKEMIAELKVEPKDFSANKARIFKFFRDRKYSISYVRKLLTIVNRYGKMVCRFQGQFFDPVPAPDKRAKQSLIEHYKTSRNFREPTEPLTPDQLDAARPKFEHLPGQWEWLKISVEFGLRPEEINAAMQDPASWKVAKVSGQEVLAIYQSKLMTIDEEDRWKYIPIIYPGQQEALKLLKTGRLVQPLPKTLKKSFTDRTRAYSGRKGFVDLMLSRGELLENITLWMGHQRIERTWSSYKSKRVVHSSKSKKSA